MTTMRILIVDDSEADFLIDSRQLARIERFLAKVSHSTDAASCRAAIESGEVDCVLLDYRLGAESGLALLTALRADGFDRSIIVLTGQGDEHTAVEAMKGGAQDYLVKDGLTHFALQRAISNAVDKVALERSLREKHDELENFVSVVAHDLRSPICTVQSSIEIIRDFYQDKPLDERGWSFIDNALTSLGRMLNLIDALLNYSLVGRSDALITKIDLNDLVQEVLTDMGVVIESCDGRIETANLPDVVGDAVTLRQLLQNLLSNALKFRSSDAPVVEFAGRRTDNGWEISVADNGIGISAGDQGTIFHPFQRLHSRSTFEGFGVGLATCQRIVDQHQGHIWVESEPGQGSTFRFTLPDGAPEGAPRSNEDGRSRVMS